LRERRGADRRRHHQQQEVLHRVSSSPDRPAHVVAHSPPLRIDENRRMRRLGIAALLAIALAGCGGGGGDDATVATSPTADATGTLHDGTAYSSAAGASLATSAETAAVTTHTIALGGTSVRYTATAGHLDARD